MNVPMMVRYVCKICGWRWSRPVRATLNENTVDGLNRPFATVCPGCEKPGSAFF